MIRLLIADDEHLIRGALVSLLNLEEDIEVVADTETSTGAIELASKVSGFVPKSTPAEEIAHKLHLAPGTVRNYLSSAMGKLGVRSRHEAAQHAWEQGWI